MKAVFRVLLTSTSEEG